MTKAVVLLSGGLDSTTTLAMALADGCEVTAISFRYGQRHTRELRSAEDVCKPYGVDPVVIDLNLSSFRSALTREELDVPMDREGELDQQIPITYVPARNIIFMSIAAGLCGPYLHRGQCGGLLWISGLPSRILRGIPGNDQQGHPGRCGG